MAIVTVGLPVYNAERYLKDCICSILSQTFKDFKLLIVNDGSTDSSMMIAKEFNDTRIEIIDDGENRGLPYRLNQIAHLSETKYLARMDADDIMHYKRLETQLGLMESHENIDVLGSNTFTIDENNNIGGLRFAPSNDTNFGIKRTEKFIHPSIIARTDWFLENPYDEQAVRCQDAELWMRTKGMYSYYVYDGSLLYYREYYQNNTSKYFRGVRALWYISIKLIKNKRVGDGLLYILKGPVKYFLLGCMFKIYGMLGKENSIIKKRSISLQDEVKEEAMTDLLKSIGS